MGGTTGEGKTSESGFQLRELLFLVLRFVLIVPFCLYVFWQIMPYYAWALGWVAASFLHFILGVPIEGVQVESGGIFNTETTLAFVMGGKASPSSIGRLVDNIAPYIALVLATGGITWKRRGVILAIGLGVLCACHFAFLVLAFYFRKEIYQVSEVANALGEVFITLPFLLWIVLAYWDKLLSLLGSSSKRA